DQTDVGVLSPGPFVLLSTALIARRSERAMEPYKSSCERAAGIGWGPAHAADWHDANSDLLQLDHPRALLPSSFSLNSSRARGDQRQLACNEVGDAHDR